MVYAISESDNVLLGAAVRTGRWTGLLWQAAGFAAGSPFRQNRS